MSGSRRNQVVLPINEYLSRHGYEVVLMATQKRSEQDFDPFFKDREYYRIVVCGGDGTIGEVIRYTQEQGIPTPLVVIPQGSGNLLAGSLGLSLTHWKRILKKGLEKEGQKIDLLKVNNHFYSSVACGVGYDTLVMRKTQRTSKRVFGVLAYVWTILKTTFYYRSQTYTIVLDGKKRSVKAKSILVLNTVPLGESVFFEHVLKHKVSPRDGVAELLLYNPRSLWSYFWYPKKPFEVLRGKSIQIKGPDTYFQIDGDVYEGSSLLVEVVPKALTIAF